MQMQAISGWMGIPISRIQIPAVHTIAADFKQICLNARAIGQWRHALKVKLGYNNMQAQAVGTGTAAYDLLLAQCPFQ